MTSREASQDSLVHLPDARRVSRAKSIEDASRLRDVSTLRQLAQEPGGLEDDELRKMAWPILLGVAGHEANDGSDQTATGPQQRRHKRQKVDKPAPTSLLARSRTLPAHHDERQVTLDVDRSFVGLLTKSASEAKARKRRDLQEVIAGVLRLHPPLHYFQGFHDIVSVCLLVLDDVDLTLACVERLSLFHIRDSMGSTIEPVMGYLRLLKRIVRAADPPLADIVEQASHLPYFSLSWVLTLLSHDLPDLASSARLFDVLLSLNPAFVAYLAAALVVEKREDVEALQRDPTSADDPAMLHTTLAKLPALSPTPTSTAVHANGVGQTTTEPPEKAEEDAALWADPDVSTPAFREIISPPLVTAATLSVDDIVTRALALWSEFPLDSPAIRASQLLGRNSCIYTYDGDLSVEDAERIVTTGEDVVVPEALIHIPPYGRPFVPVLRRHTLLTAVGIAGVGVALALALGERRALSLAELVYTTVGRFLGL